MARPLVLIHGYSDKGDAFDALKSQLLARNIPAVDLNVAQYISLNNEITIKDIAEGFDRAIRDRPGLKDGQEFDAVVHSTGMLVIRSWLTNYGAPAAHNTRLQRLKHLIGLAPATWGSPQAHKGRTWIGAFVKGNREPGPDFLNAGDEVLDALELGSRFTWDLAHLDLLGAAPFYDAGDATPYPCVFVGNSPYTNIASIANEPGTDGTVRWSGCGLNTRKVTIDLTRSPIRPDGRPAPRASMTKWAGRLDVPIIPVNERNHATIIGDPEPGMIGLIVDFLKIQDSGSYAAWLIKAGDYGKLGREKMLVDPGKDAAGLKGDFKQFFGHLFASSGKPIEGWQQFVVHARDERGDPVTDYVVDILQKTDNGWEPFPDLSTDVHAYQTDQSFRCFHIRLPKGVSDGKIPLRARLHASTGTALMAYQGYGSDEAGKTMTPLAQPVEIDLQLENGDSLFYPFTTTLIEVILNREPSPLDKVSDIFKFLS